MTTALAIIAIVISVLTLAWTIWWSIYTHRRATVPTLSVLGAFGTPVYDLPGGGRTLGDECLDVTVLNEGSVRLTVSGVHYEIEGRSETLAVPRWLVQDPAPLPVVLEPGEQWHGLVPLEGVVESLTEHLGGSPPRVRPVAAAAGRRFRAEEWLEVA